MGALRNRLLLMAEASRPNDTEVILAALRIGATMALARVREVGGEYSGSSDLRKVMDDLEGRDERDDAASAKPAKPLVAEEVS